MKIEWVGWCNRVASGINIKACVASPSPGEGRSNTIGLVLKGEDNDLTLTPRYLSRETACLLSCPYNCED
jgi:hypothetical protein